MSLTLLVLLLFDLELLRLRSLIILITIITIIIVIIIIIIIIIIVRITSNENRTEWSPVRSAIVRVITKSDDRAEGVRFVNHEYDYRPNWIINFICRKFKIYNNYLQDKRLKERLYLHYYCTRL